MHLKVTVIDEAGYNAAAYGMSLSYKDRAIRDEDWWNSTETIDKAYKRLETNAPMDGGHNKGLEHIYVWLDIEAPRYIWQELDTYRVGVSKQSESTMHTMSHRPIEVTDFEDENIDWAYLYDINEVLNEYKEQDYPEKRDTFVRLKGMIPEGYLQRREMCVNYKTLRNIILQRRNHRLPHWQEFIKCVLEQVKHPELLPKLED